MQNCTLIKHAILTALKTTQACSALAVAITCLSAQSYAAPEPGPWTQDKTVQLNTYFDALAAQKQFNGAVLIAENGEIVYEKYHGFANINDKTKRLGPHSSFRLGSVSKHFMAMAIMMLKEQGKLNFDDNIQKHLPTLPYAGITIRQLLHHTSGLADYELIFENHWDTGNDFDDRKFAYNKDVIELYSKLKPNVLFEPGEDHQYSNTGYVMLGQIVENASGTALREFLQKNIFTPLHMNDSQAFSPEGGFNVAERVYGFTLLADGLSHEDNDRHFLNGMIGDGGIYASARDMLKWDQAWYGNKLVSQQSIAEAYVLGKTRDNKTIDYGTSSDGGAIGYGFGLVVGENKDGKVTSVSHGGSWVGFETQFQRNLKTKRTAIVLTNDSGASINHMLYGLRQLYQGEPLDIPPKPINHELAAVIEANGIDAAIERYNNISQSKNQSYIIRDELIDQLASFYRNKGQNNISKKLDALISARQDIKLSKEQMEAFIGTYALSEHFKIEISIQGTQLIAQATDQQALQLTPISENRFKVNDVDAEVSFTNFVQGQTGTLVLHQNGADQKAARTNE